MLTDEIRKKLFEQQDIKYRDFQKKLIPNVMDELKKVRVNIPVQLGQVVLPDVCGTGIPIIATRPLP